MRLNGIVSVGAKNLKNLKKAFDRNERTGLFLASTFIKRKARLDDALLLLVGEHQQLVFRELRPQWIRRKRKRADPYTKMLVHAIAVL